MWGFGLPTFAVHLVLGPSHNGSTPLTILASLWSTVAVHRQNVWELLVHFLVMAALPVNLPAVGTDIEHFYLSEHCWWDFFHPDLDSVGKQCCLCVQVVKTVGDSTSWQWNVVCRQLTVCKMLYPCLLHVDWMYQQILVTVADLPRKKLHKDQLHLDHRILQQKWNNYVTYLSLVH